MRPIMVTVSASNECGGSCTLRSFGRQDWRVGHETVPTERCQPDDNPQSSAYINLRAARAVGTWKTEARNVAQDYRSAFGTEPDTLKYIAILNDNDQTGDACSALFRPILDAR